MGQVASSARRYALNFNVVNRAERVVKNIESGKLTNPPPNYRGARNHGHTAEEKQIINEKVTEKYPELVNRLERVFVKASDPPPEVKSKRPLPSRSSQAKMGYLDPEYGFYEPPVEDIPAGKLTFREALQLMSAKAAHDRDPSDSSASDLLQEHLAARRVSAEQLDNMFTYFMPFESVSGQVLLRADQSQALLHAAKPGGFPRGDNLMDLVLSDDKRDRDRRDFNREHTKTDKMINDGPETDKK